MGVAEEATLAMQSYIKETSKERGIEGVAATPATDNLFRIDEEAETLPKAAKEKLHRAVAQSLRLATRVRPITLLCSRVVNPTIEDLDKLSRAMKCLNGASELGLKLGKRDKDMGVAVYADASYAYDVSFVAICVFPVFLST